MLGSADADEILTLTHATERDVDLIVVEELKASRAFLEWFLSVNKIPADEINSWRVTHSKRRTLSRREIDIAIHVRRSKSPKVIWLIVENKLDETEQPNQGESYADEKARLKLEGNSDLVATALICPTHYAEQYAGFVRKFDRCVSYEEIVNFLRSRAVTEGGELRYRLEFRADLFDQAISKARRGYQQIPLKPIGTFNERYADLCRKIAPELPLGQNMLRPEGNPAGSSSMIFDQSKAFDLVPEEVRPRRLSHELSQGHRTTHYAAVTIAAWGARIEELRARLEKSLQGTKYLVRAAAKATEKRKTPGLVIYVLTPPANNLGDFEEQRAALEIGIRETDKLRRWVIDNVPTLLKWKRLFDEVSALDALPNQK